MYNRKCNKNHKNNLFKLLYDNLPSSNANIRIYSLRISWDLNCSRHPISHWTGTSGVFFQLICWIYRDFVQASLFEFLCIPWILILIIFLIFQLVFKINYEITFGSHRKLNPVFGRPLNWFLIMKSFSSIWIINSWSTAAAVV